LSAEAFALKNLLMNFLILTLSARCMGHIRWKRVICASVLGTAYAALVYARSDWLWIRSTPAQIAGLIGMALVVFGDRPMRTGWIGCMCLAGGVIFSGGVMLLLGRWFPGGSPLLTLVGCMVMGISAFIGDVFRRETPVGGRVRLRIGTRMGTVEVRALVDTGNRLHEPLSGLPVVIVEKDALTGILDRSCLTLHQNRRLPGFRRVSYSVLGGSGEMVCFRPKSVELKCGNEWREGPEVWIGIYQGQLPASMEALAPPDFSRNSAFYGG